MPAPDAVFLVAIGLGQSSKPVWMVDQGIATFAMLTTANELHPNTVTKEFLKSLLAVWALVKPNTEIGVILVANIESPIAKT
jgi:hypothetical protein